MLHERLEARAAAARGKDGQTDVMRPNRPADMPCLMRGYDAMSEQWPFAANHGEGSSHDEG